MVLFFLDIIYSISTVLSFLLAGLSLIFIYRLPIKSDEKSKHFKVIKISQMGMFLGLVIYHASVLPCYAVDVLLSEANGWSYWDAENLKGLLIVPALAGMAFSVANCSTWTAILVSILLMGRGIPSKGAEFILNSNFIFYTNMGHDVFVALGITVICILFKDDGVRAQGWATILLDVLLIMTFFVLAPSSAYLTKIYREAKGQKVGLEAQKGLLRVIFFTAAISILCIVALYFITISNVAKYPGRLLRDYNADEVNEFNRLIYQARNQEYDGKYKSSHITFPLFLYSLAGTFSSAPFALRKDFFKLLWNGSGVVRTEPRIS